MNYKIDFEELNWETPIEGVRHKYFDQNGIRLRIVEYSKDMPLHWCSKGHYGYILDGEMEIEYLTGNVVYTKGDGIFIPDGDEHKHMGKVRSGKVTIFFLENICNAKQ